MDTDRKGGRMTDTSSKQKIWYKHWPQEVAKHLDYPDTTLAEILQESAEKNSGKTAIIFLDTTMSYGDLWDRVKRMAKGLSDLGLKKGDICALILPNSYQYVVSFYACQLLGVVVTAINPTYKSLEVSYQLKDSNSKAVIVLDSIYKEVEKGIKDANVKTVIGTNIVDLCGFPKIKISG